MRGADVVMRALAQRGVKTVFSLSGNQIMPLYDACIDTGIRIVHVRHEAAAVFMADAWAQVTGELGVAMLTAAPGVSNGIGPLYSALQAESPVLLLSGDSSVSEDGRGAFQEMDQVAMTRPLTKFSHRPMSVDALDAAVDDAVTAAFAGRRGPVHLALPFDVLEATVTGDADSLSFSPHTPAASAPALSPRTPAASAPALSPHTPAASVPPLPFGLSLSKASDDLRPDDVQLSEIETLLRTSRRPLLLVGPSGCRTACRADIERDARKLGVPPVFMESPRGLRDPSLGAVAERIAEADVVVLLAKPADFTLSFGRKVLHADAQVVAIDPDDAMLDRSAKALGAQLRIRCRGETRATLAALASRAGAATDRAAWSQAVMRSIADRTLKPVATPTSDRPTPQAVCERVQAFLATREEVVLVCDGGEFGQWAQAFCAAPVRVINGTSGAIGGGIAYAIAARIARPNATVVLMMGDGTAGFHFAEFETALREAAPFIAVIGNDSRWNAEHLIQMRAYGADRLIGCELTEDARYHDAAAGFGAFGAAPRTLDQLTDALAAAAESGCPACINVAIDGRAAPLFAAAAPASH